MAEAAVTLKIGRRVRGNGVVAEASSSAVLLSSGAGGSVRVTTTPKETSMDKAPQGCFGADGNPRQAVCA